MNATPETWNQQIIGRRPFSRFFQIDRLVTLVTGTGSHRTPPFHLPWARYTVFTAYDPPESVESLLLIDANGHALPDWSVIPVSAGQVGAPPVQHELAAGRYELQIRTATPGCAWKIQVVLNSMLSWETPPPAWRPAEPPPEPITLRSGEGKDFQISRTGHYGVNYVIGDPDGTLKHRDTTLKQWDPTCTFTLDLRAADGHAVHLAQGEANKAELVGMAFLGEGHWTVEMQTNCQWQLVLTPMLGRSGGGARWF